MIKNVVRPQTPSNWGVLCIDTWECNGEWDDLYSKAVDKLSQYNIKVTINASKSMRIDYNDISVFNALKFYVWEADQTYYETNRCVKNEILDYSGFNTTNKIIKDKLFDKNTICLNNINAFTNYVDRFFPMVKDWIVLGQSWGVCLHNNPVSFKSLLSMAGHNFNIFPEWSVFNTDQTPVTIQQVDDDNYVWAEIPDNGFRLVTIVDGIKWKRD